MPPFPTNQLKTNNPTVRPERPFFSPPQTNTATLPRPPTTFILQQNVVRNSPKGSIFLGSTTDRPPLPRPTTPNKKNNSLPPSIYILPAGGWEPTIITQHKTIIKGRQLVLPKRTGAGRGERGRPPTFTDRHSNLPHHPNLHQHKENNHCRTAGEGGPPTAH